jgi:hypothetical protein
MLEAKGIPCSLSETFDPPRGLAAVDLVFRRNPLHVRALAKISFNYLAHQHGRDIAYEPRFDAIRRLVVDGIQPPDKYYVCDERPILADDKKGRRLNAHFLIVETRREGPVGIDGIVSLYNRFRHSVRLSAVPGTGLPRRGHLFDVHNRRIRSLPFSVQ